MSNRLKVLAATLIGTGLVPGAPGTYASVVAAAAFVLAGRPAGFAGWAALVALFVLAAWALGDVEALLGASDPRECVIDEAAGMWLALLVAAPVGWWPIACAFGLFRLLDMAKPFPIGRLERLKGWIGIMADDVAAGLAAGAVTRHAFHFIAP